MKIHLVRCSECRARAFVRVYRTVVGGRTVGSLVVAYNRKKCEHSTLDKTWYSLYTVTNVNRLVNLWNTRHIKLTAYLGRYVCV